MHGKAQALQEYLAYLLHEEQVTCLQKHRHLLQPDKLLPDTALLPCSSCAMQSCTVTNSSLSATGVWQQGAASCVC